MKKLIFLLLSATSLLAQQPPVLRTPVTTNVATFNSPVAGQILAIHSVGGVITWTNVADANDFSRWRWSYARLALTNAPLRVAGMGDSVGDDTVLALLPVLTNAFGENGGYLTVTKDGTDRPLTWNTNVNATTSTRTTNWWALHFVVTNGAEVTFSRNGDFIDADTYRVAHVRTPQGGTYKVQLQTNGGAFADITGTIDTTGSLAGAVTTITTNRGNWKLKVVGLSGTNIIVGAGIWASNKVGVRLSELWEGGLAINEISTTVSTNVTAPILGDLGLDLVTFKNVDAAASYQSHLNGFQQMLKHAVTNGDIVLIGGHPIIGAGAGSDADVQLGNSYLRDCARTNGWSYIDGFGLFGSTNDLYRLGWMSDGIHLLQGGREFLAAQFLRQMRLLENPQFSASYATPAYRHRDSYTIVLATAFTTSPTDALTTHFGGDFNAPHITYGNVAVEVPQFGRIKRVFLKIRHSVGSGETVSHFLRLNDTTDVVQLDTPYNAAGQTTDLTATLDHAVVPGDVLAFKVVCPTWATNPTGVRWYALIYIE